MNTPERTALCLSPTAADQIVREAQAALPNECCGLLIGRGGTVSRALAIPNTADLPQVGFIMDERALAHALMALEGGPDQLAGFYHSHPTSDPLPSPTDIRAAAYPDAAHVIIGLRGQPRLAAWRIAHGQVTRLDLRLEEETSCSDADVNAFADANTPASVLASSLRPQTQVRTQTQVRPAHVAAILISALLVTLLVLTISLSLLPPAPLIPGR